MDRKVQWNVRTRDTLGATILSLVERSFLYLGGKITISMVPQQVSFIERSSLSYPLYTESTNEQSGG